MDAPPRKTAITPKMRPNWSFGFGSVGSALSPIATQIAATTNTPMIPYQPERPNSLTIASA